MPCAEFSSCALVEGPQFTAVVLLYYDVTVLFVEFSTATYQPNVAFLQTVDLVVAQRGPWNFGIGLRPSLCVDGGLERLGGGCPSCDRSW